MFFVDRLELDKTLRQLRSIYGQVDEGLRGWNWMSDLLSPPLENVHLGVSEIANRYCPTFRDIYLRRIEGVEAPYTYKTIRGWLYHAVSSKTVQEVKAILYKEEINGPRLYSELLVRRKKIIDEILEKYEVERRLGEAEAEKLRKEMETIYMFLALQAAAQLDKILAKVKWAEVEDLVSIIVPMDVERVVDGSLLGLSKELRIDIFTDKRLVVDIKTGDTRDFHKYALAGYALALESSLEIPIDYGMITYLSVDKGVVKISNNTYFIGDELRREFLEIRDEAFNIIHRGEDPGKPPKCPRYCIYYNVCNPGEPP